MFEKSKKLSVLPSALPGVIGTKRASHASYYRLGCSTIAVATHTKSFAKLLL